MNILTAKEELVIAKTLATLFHFIEDAEIVEEFDDDVWLKVNRKDYETILQGINNETENNSAS